jgi:hypothetical protein
MGKQKKPSRSRSNMKHIYTLGTVRSLSELLTIETTDQVADNVRTYSDGTRSTGPQYMELPEPNAIEAARNYRREEQIKQLTRMRQRVIDWANQNRVYPRSRRVFWMMKIHYILLQYGIRLDLSADLESAAYGTRDKDLVGQLQ